MRKTLEALIKLQEIDCQLRAIEQSKGDLPQRIGAISEEIEEKQAALNDRLARIENHRASQRNAEAEVSLLRERLKKYQDQLYKVKTNKEYDAITLELENTESSIDKFEYQVLESEEEEKELQAETEELEPQLQALQATLVASEQQLQVMMATNAEKEAELLARRQSIVGLLSRQVLSMYERIRHGRGGIALAFLKDGACSQCSSRIPPQRGLEIRMMNNMFVCEVCGRILVWDEMRDTPCIESEMSKNK
ncbi:hypothetical protein JXO59_10755 [candidate division KSB1 bacterium]|nr:hypothetical protein [candidate division KSB1 bacterium]